MKCLYFLPILIFLSGNIFAQNPTLSGEIDSDTTWNSDTVFIDDNLYILQMATLTISPGVTVMLSGGSAIEIEGRLLALGSIEEPILFTSTDTAGYYEFTHTGWGGILFDNRFGTLDENDTSKFVHCEFSYGNNYWGGGAIRVIGFDKILIDHCEFHHNYTNEDGGAIKLEEEAIAYVTNSRFHDNNGRRGGGAVAIGCHDDIELFDQAVFKHCIFFNNKSLWGGTSYGGGAMKLAGYSDPLIESCGFVNNSSTTKGGAIAVTGFSSSYLINNVFYNNQSNHHGAAIALKNNTGAYVINNSIINNYTEGYGAAISVSCNNEYLLFMNNIVYMNQNSSGSYPSIYLADSYYTVGTGDEDMFFLNNNIQGGLDSFPDINNQNNIDADPVFVNMWDGNFCLACGSPCIDQGKDSTEYMPGYDFIGIPHNINGMYDMGAFETLFPEVNLGEDFDMYNNDTHTLDAGEGFTSYLWNTNENTSSIEIDGSLLLPGDYEYWVEVENEYNCTGSDSIIVTIMDWGNVEEHNAFYKVYPNPTHGVINIEAADTEISLYNLQGIEIMSTKLSDEIETIDFSHQKAGIYFLKLKKDNKTSNLKLVIQ